MTRFAKVGGPSPSPPLSPAAEGHGSNPVRGSGQRVNRWRNLQPEPRHPKLRHALAGRIRARTATASAFQLLQINYRIDGVCKLMLEVKSDVFGGLPRAV